MWSNQTRKVITDIKRIWFRKEAKALAREAYTDEPSGRVFLDEAFFIVVVIGRDL